MKKQISPLLFSQIRKGNDLTQREMAENLGGYTERTIQNWEKGSTPVEPAVVVLLSIWYPDYFPKEKTPETPKKSSDWWTKNENT